MDLFKRRLVVGCPIYSNILVLGCPTWINLVVTIQYTKFVGHPSIKVFLAQKKIGFLFSRVWTRSQETIRKWWFTIMESKLPHQTKPGLLSLCPPFPTLLHETLHPTIYHTVHWYSLYQLVQDFFHQQDGSSSISVSKPPITPILKHNLLHFQ